MFTLSSLQEKIRCFTAFLLLLVFTAIQLTGILHRHPEAPSEKIISSYETVQHKHTQHAAVSSSVKCKLCNLVFHKHSTFLHTTAMPSVALMPVEISTLKLSKSQKLFETAIHSWTNKGPPVCG